MTRRVLLAVVFSGLAGVVTVSQAVGQATQPATTGPADAGDGSLVYQVIAVKGKVRVSPTGLDPKTTQGWAYVKVGEEIGQGIQVYVPWRGAVKLVARPADPPTVILIDRSSLVNISELSIKEGVAKSRIKIAYGAVRAGVAEGTTRSDMEIEAPVATLSKRGTDIFGFSYRNGNFDIWLTDQGWGMIRAIQQQATGFGGRTRQLTRSITAGQFVTQQMAMVIENVQFDQHISITDLFGLDGADQLFALLNGSGIGFLLPQGGNVVHFLDSPTPEGTLGGTPGFDPGTGAPLGVLSRPLLQHIIRQNAGDFGIGQGLVPGVFGSGSSGKGLRLGPVHGINRGRQKQQTLRRLGRKR